jgi:hypothetical protein
MAFKLSNGAQKQKRIYIKVEINDTCVLVIGISMV